MSIAQILTYDEYARLELIKQLIDTLGSLPRDDYEIEKVIKTAEKLKNYVTFGAEEAIQMLEGNQ